MNIIKIMMQFCWTVYLSTEIIIIFRALDFKSRQYKKLRTKIFFVYHEVLIYLGYLLLFLYT
jgi:hypothetical protein